MKKTLFIFAALFMASIAFADTEPQTEDPHMQGFWLVLINANDEPVWVELNEGDEGHGHVGYFAHTMWLNCEDYGSYVANEDDSNRPFVPFYFMIDGVRYGAETEMEPAIIGDPYCNILIEESEEYYGLPVGYYYKFGVTTYDGHYYALAAYRYSDIDELSSCMQVASVRYFNMAGQEMQQANGMTIVVTTYTDGTTSTMKVMK